jgi:hypothetical protein
MNIITRIDGIWRRATAFHSGMYCFNDGSIEYLYNGMKGISKARDWKTISSLTTENSIDNYLIDFNISDLRKKNPKKSPAIPTLRRVNLSIR